MKIKIKLSLKVAIGSFLIAGFGVIVFAFLSFSQVSEYFKQNLLHYISIELKSDASDIKSSVDGIIYDISILAKSDEVKGIIRAYKNRYHYDKMENIKFSDWKKRLQKEFFTYIEQNKGYFQIRFIGIDENGRELVRLDKKNNEIRVIKEIGLQQKAKRYYFKETIKLQEREVYISPIDLNKEHGNIVFPIIPTIRVATPVYHNKKVFGMIIINANIDILFNLMKYKDIKGKQLYLANLDGYYLFNQDIDKTFGFEFKRNIKIQNDFTINELFNKNSNEISSYQKNNLAFFAQKINISDNNRIILARSATDLFFKEQSSEYKKKMYLYIFIIALLIAISSAVLTRILTSPITDLTKRAKKVADTDGEDDVIFKDIKSNDEIGDLSNSINIMVNNLVKSKKELKEFAFSLEGEVAMRVKEQEILLSIFDKGDAILFKWKNDKDWSVEYVSSSIFKLLGYNKDEFLDEKIIYSELIDKDDVDRVEMEVTEAIDNKQDYFEHKPYRIKTRDNDTKWVHDYTLIVRDESGEITHFLGYLTDITKLKELNDHLEKKVNEGINEIQDKNELLAQQTKLAAMGEMIGAIAHQWRQPLNALAVQVQFMEDDFEDGFIDAKYLEEYKQENMKLINFMSKTIDDFRNFFRVDKIKTVFNVREKVSETINIISAQLKENDIKISIIGDGFDVLGFASEFQQVILNVINNAKDVLIEKNIEAGEIIIELKYNNTNGIITIQDNGGGIPADIIKRIFEPYFTTKEQGKGTGLGLYMSKMIIKDNMQGELDVSNGDKGAIFKIELKVNYD